MKGIKLPSFLFAKDPDMVIILVISVLVKGVAFIGMVYVNNIFRGGEQAGQFFLILSCFQVGLVLANGGHTYFYSRLLARSGPYKYQWGNDLFFVCLFSSVLAVLVTLFIGLFYNFNPWLIFLLGFYIVIYNFSFIISGVARGHHSIINSFFVQNLHHIAWPALFFVSIFLLNDKEFVYYKLLIAYAVALLFPFILGIQWLIKNWDKQGDTPIRWDTRQESIIFYMLSIAAIALPYADKMIVGAKKESLSVLAAYQGVTLLFSLYDVIMIAIGWVMMPKLAREERDPRKHFFSLIKIMVWSIPLGILAWIFVPHVNSLLYFGRFDGYNYLIPYLVVMGTFKLIYSVLTSIVSGQGESLDLWLQGLSALSLMVFSVVGMNYGLDYWGLKGLVIVQVLIWGLRCLLTGGIVALWYRKKTALIN